MTIFFSLRRYTPESTGRRLVLVEENVTRWSAWRRGERGREKDVSFSTAAIVGYSLAASPAIDVFACCDVHFKIVPSLVSSNTSASLLYCAKFKIAFAGIVTDPSFSIFASQLVIILNSKSVALTVHRLPCASIKIFPKIGNAC